MAVPLTGWERLSEAQVPGVRRVIEDESLRREHLVVSLSGAHAYGFPSPDSGVELRCVHVAPTEELLGLATPEGGAERVEELDGVEVDYGSNEVGHVLRGLLGGNGSYLERVVGGCALTAGPGLEGLQALAPELLSKRYYRHYRSLSQSQERETGARPTARRFLNVLRSALTGANLLAMGAVVTDVERLVEAFHLGAGLELLERARAGEQARLEPRDISRFRRLVESAFAALENANRASGLKEDPPGVDAADAWLRALRRARLR